MAPAGQPNRHASGSPLIAIVKASTATLAHPLAATPLRAAAALSIALHAVLLAAFGSVLTSSWRGDGFAPAPGSGPPLQAVLAPPAADPAPAPPQPPVESPPPQPPTPVEPPQATQLAPASPGLTQPGAGPASVPRRPPAPPAAAGDIAVGMTTDISTFGLVAAARLAAQFPVRPGRLPRLARTLTVTYPEQALRDGTDARVGALLLLDAKGVVLETTIEPDDPIFAPAVREALATATFVPAQAADTPLPYWIALEFVFAIDPMKAPTAR